MARHRQQIPGSLAEVLAFDESLDQRISGVSLSEGRGTRLADEGAHDPTATHYFVLEELFSHLAFDDGSHLLDVGCGKGRVLAHFVRQRYPGRATGIELDPELAEVAARWVGRYDSLSIISGSVLDNDLSRYTHFYLFNPFSPGVLQAFIESLEAQLTHAATIVHMSDNGDTWHYVGRSGWTELTSGSIQYGHNARGYPFEVYDCPQHYTIWRYEP